MSRITFKPLNPRALSFPPSSSRKTPSHQSQVRPSARVKRHTPFLEPRYDCRALKAATIPDRYPVPNVRYCTALFRVTTIFSKIDPVKAYHQISVESADTSKTAIITHFGLFEFIQMPFGPRNAAQMFQPLIDEVTHERPFCFAYLDNILIASSDNRRHKQHLRALF